MVINILAMITAALLALSPFLTQVPLINQMLGYNLGPLVGSGYKWGVAIMGGGVFLLSLYNLYIRRRSGMVFIVIGAVSLVSGYFYNDERFAAVPLNHVFLGGSAFIAFVASCMLILLGLAQEFLLDPD